ncbi:MAG: hypothetical protein ACOCZ6_06155 [Nanoarchaeota archaeon]
MGVDEIFSGYTVTVIGGVYRADYESRLQQLGFEKVYRSYDKKDLKKMPKLLNTSDIGIVVGGCCSHDQLKKAKQVCGELEVPLINIPGSPGPLNVTKYLLENHQDIYQRLHKS